MKMNSDLYRLQQLLLKIPRGQVTTYKLLAHAMGIHAYRYIGQLLKSNPDPDRFPCFKVVRSDGSPGGYSRGEKEKIRRLLGEGIETRQGKIVHFKKQIHHFI